LHFASLINNKKKPRFSLNSLQWKLGTKRNKDWREKNLWEPWQKNNKPASSDITVDMLRIDVAKRYGICLGIQSEVWPVSGSIPGTDLWPWVGEKHQKSPKSEPKKACNAPNYCSTRSSTIFFPLWYFLLF